jgi:chorismate mutase-like protein
MSNESLDILRKEIDGVDSRLVELLNQRAAIALEIGKIKSQTGKEAYDPNREKKVLDAISAINKGPLPKGSIEDIYSAIITACRELQIDSL